MFTSDVKKDGQTTIISANAPDKGK